MGMANHCRPENSTSTTSRASKLISIHQRVIVLVTPYRNLSSLPDQAIHFYAFRAYTVNKSPRLIGTVAWRQYVEFSSRSMGRPSLPNSAVKRVPR